MPGIDRKDMLAAFLMRDLSEALGISYFPPHDPHIQGCARVKEKPELVPTIGSQVGLQIRNRRLRSGMTQLALAQKVHVDEATVSRHERGMNITLDIIPAYAEALECRLYDLIPQEQGEVLYEHRQERINQVIDEFQRLKKLSDDELEEVLQVIEGIIKVSLR